MLIARLTGVLDSFELIPGSASEVTADDASGLDIEAVHYDSRRVTPRSLFCCLVGDRADGHEFAPQAVARGASALLVERPLPVPVTQIRVTEARRAMALLSAELEDNPSHELDVVGITGTNGKTTTAHLIGSILEHAGRRTGVIGTLTGARTTPEAPDLQRQLRSLCDEGVEAVAMEVSSHALALHRVDGTRFGVAVFTNLGRDHLDFHVDEEAYFSTKARLFTDDLAERAVVCTDDGYGRRLIDSISIPAVAYSCAGLSADVDLVSSRFEWRGQSAVVPLGGRFNICNALAAAEAALALGLAPDEIVAGLAAATPVPGRFEPVDRGQDFAVLVDYAHTPDGLEQLLKAVDELTAGQVIVVFGCGGDRDRSKRPEMGAVASRYADQVIVTSDNPRGEDPMMIIDEVLAGMPGGTAHVEVDRRDAIGRALAAASSGDAVVIAGKGHETTQVTGAEVVDFDDRQVAADGLATLLAGKGRAG